MIDFPARRLILLAGPQHWGNEAGHALLAASNLPEELVWWNKTAQAANTILGQDKAIVIIDAYLGLNPDLLGRVSGTIRAGGALVIICPGLDEWPHYADPQKAKLTPYPLDCKTIDGQYLSRWVRLIKQFDGIERFTPASDASPNPVMCALPSATLDSACTDDQQNAIDAIIKAATGQRRRPAIIRADRGRGKSAAMGIVAGRLICDNALRHIIVTASEAKQTSTLFKHAQAVLHTVWPECEFNDDSLSLRHDDAIIEFKTPEALISSAFKTDLLLVDEAASLGVTRLEPLLLAYPRIAFATTEHGYEGSGRGFSLKFKQLVRHHCRGQYDIKLIQPIRWAEQDPLEQWLNKLLLLDAVNDSFSPSVPITTNKLSLKKISQQTLGQDETLLNQVFHLLVEAHYQTRPSDVRYLLDACNSQLWVVQHQGNIVGLVWLMMEGQIDESTARQIVAGKRRPQGHLAPQILAAHLGLYEAATQSCVRIQRIVVKPALQNKGIGSWMLAELNKNLQGKIDYLASSFGCDLALTRFWQRAGYKIVRIGDKRHAASGLHSALVINALSNRAKQMTSEASDIFTQQLITQLNTSLATLSPALVSEWLTSNALPQLLHEHDTKTAVLFAYGNRPIESSLSSLHKLGYYIFETPIKLALTDPQRYLFIARILQNQAWDNCSTLAGMKGKSQCLQSLRQIVQVLLAHISNPCKVTQIRWDYGLMNTLSN